MDTGRDVLHSRVFDGLTEADRRACLTSATVVTARTGQWLARQGDPATTFYLIATGALKIVQNTPEGQELIVRFVGAGDPFGGVVVLEHATYPISALAVETTTLHAWSAAELQALVTQFPRLSTNIMREMAAHMTDALTRVREVTTQRVGRRLAMTLVRLARQGGRPHEDGILLTHVLTQQELADLTGTTLYTVSRTLSKWKSDGILSSHARRLIIRSPKRLSALADGSVDE
jgi:CRP-like cAMP-binding protein